MSKSRYLGSEWRAAIGTTRLPVIARQGAVVTAEPPKMLQANLAAKESLGQSFLQMGLSVLENPLTAAVLVAGMSPPFAQLGKGILIIHYIIFSCRKCVN